MAGGCHPGQQRNTRNIQSHGFGPRGLLGPLEPGPACCGAPGPGAVPCEQSEPLSQDPRLIHVLGSQTQLSAAAGLLAVGRPSRPGLPRTFPCLALKTLRPGKRISAGQAGTCRSPWLAATAKEERWTSPQWLSSTQRELSLSCPFLTHPPAPRVRL